MSSYVLLLVSYRNLNIFCIKEDGKFFDELKNGSFNDIDQLCSETLCLELAFKEKNLVKILNSAINLSGLHSVVVSDPNYGVLALKYCYENKDNGLMRAALSQIAEIISGDASPQSRVIAATLTYILEGRDGISAAEKMYIHTDLKYYYLALIAFISEDYVNVRLYADMSQYPEAFWLLGMLDYRDGNYSKSCEKFEKAVKMGLKAAYANLAHLSVLTKRDQKSTLTAFEGAALHEDALGLKTLYWRPLIDELKESGFFGVTPLCDQKGKPQLVADDESLNALVAEIENIGKISGNKKRKNQSLSLQQ